jgi:hypothetical protein
MAAQSIRQPTAQSNRGNAFKQLNERVSGSVMVLFLKSHKRPHFSTSGREGEHPFC